MTLFNSIMEIDLFKVSKDEFGAAYDQTLLDQYTIYINTAEKVSEKRQSANSLFLTLNAALLTYIGHENVFAENSDVVTIAILASLVGFFLCYHWMSLINSYKSLNKAKFEIIHLIERRLPLSLFESEWNLLKGRSEGKSYKDLTDSEKWIPRILSFVYFAIFCFAIGRLVSI